MSKPEDDREFTDLEVPGRKERRRLGPLTKEEEKEADRLGTTRALQTAEDPAVTAALAVIPEGQSLVVYVLVLVQQIYRLVARLVESVTAIRETVSRPPRRTSGSMAAVGEPSAEPSSLETAVSEMQGTLEVLKSALDRIEQVQAQEQKPAASVAAPAYVPSVTSRQFAIVLALALGVLILTTAITFLDWLESPSLAPQSDLVSEFTTLRDAYNTLEASNVALADAVEKVTGCGHQECRDWRLESTGVNQKKVFYNCVWVTDPTCPSRPSSDE